VQPREQRARALGVVFVHGIGGQGQGRTLSLWGDALVAWLEKHPALSHVSLRNTRVRPLGDEPAHAYLELSIDQGAKQSWLLTEGWWQGQLTAPSYAELIAWSTKVLPTALFTHMSGIVGRMRAGRSGTGALERGVFLATVLGLGVPLVLMLAPLLVIVALALLVIGLIPVAGLRSGVLRVQRVMTGAVGDSMMFVASPTYAAAMMSQVLASVDFLRSSGCAHVVVVAHSQGAAIAVEALSQTHGPRVDTLITVGSGINKLDTVRRTARRPLLNWLPQGLLLAVLLLSWRVLTDLRAGTTSPLELAGYSVGLLGAFLTVALLADGLERYFPQLADKATGVLGLAPGIMLFALPDPVQWFLFTLLAVGVTLLVVASQLKQDEVEVAPALSDRVAQWVDLYARSDPVPNGPTRTGRVAWPRSIEVHNLDSVWRDHTYYARAHDDAMTAIGEALMGAANDTDVPYSRSVAARRAAGRRRWRVLCLRAVRLIVALAALIGIVTHFEQLDNLGRWTYEEIQSLLPGNTDLARGSEQTSAMRIVGIMVVALGAAVAYWGLFAVWRTWRDNPYAETRPSSGPASEEAMSPQDKSRVYVGVLCAACVGLVLLAARAQHIQSAIQDGQFVQLAESLTPWLLGVAGAGYAVQWLVSSTGLDERWSRAPEI